MLESYIEYLCLIPVWLFKGIHHMNGDEQDLFFWGTYFTGFFGIGLTLAYGNGAEWWKFKDGSDVYCACVCTICWPVILVIFLIFLPFSLAADIGKAVSEKSGGRRSAPSRKR